MTEELINSCLNNERRAHEQFYKLCYQKFIRTCMKYSKDREQVIFYFNMGFAKVLLNLEQYNKELPFDFWAKKVIINAVLDELKKEKRTNEILVLKEDLSQLNASNTETKFNEYDLERIELIKEKAKKLPPMTHKVFNLYAFEGYMHHEIAKILDINENTSMWHYSDAKKRIKQMLNL